MTWELCADLLGRYFSFFLTDDMGVMDQIDRWHGSCRQDLTRILGLPEKMFQLFFSACHEVKIVFSISFPATSILEVPSWKSHVRWDKSVLPSQYLPLPSWKSRLGSPISWGKSAFPSQYLPLPSWKSYLGKQIYLMTWDFQAQMGLPRWKGQAMRWEDNFTLWHRISRMEVAVAGNEMGKQFKRTSWHATSKMGLPR